VAVEFARSGLNQSIEEQIQAARANAVAAPAEKV
jgi:hypothetical protein